ncbi:MAG: hypothetical protein HYX53_00440 [Chloroflexi bacterium]|nr:hypothetical protein [Chloroflexota bacterium]
MNNDQVRERLADYALGLLDPQDAETVAGVAAKSEAIRAEACLYVQAAEALVLGAPPIPLPAGALERIAAGVARRLPDLPVAAPRGPAENGHQSEDGHAPAVTADLAAPGREERSPGFFADLLAAEGELPAPWDAAPEPVADANPAAAGGPGSAESPGESPPIAATDDTEEPPGDGHHGPAAGHSASGQRPTADSAATEWHGPAWKRRKLLRQRDPGGREPHPDRPRKSDPAPPVPGSDATIAAAISGAPPPPFEVPTTPGPGDTAEIAPGAEPAAARTHRRFGMFRRAAPDAAATGPELESRLAADGLAAPAAHLAHPSADPMPGPAAEVPVATALDEPAPASLEEPAAALDVPAAPVTLAANEVAAIEGEDLELAPTLADESPPAAAAATLAARATFDGPPPRPAAAFTDESSAPEPGTLAADGRDFLSGVDSYDDGEPETPGAPGPARAPAPSRRRFGIFRRAVPAPIAAGSVEFPPVPAPVSPAGASESAVEEPPFAPVLDLDAFLEDSSQPERDDLAGAVAHAPAPAEARPIAEPMAEPPDAPATLTEPGAPEPEPSSVAEDGGEASPVDFSEDPGDLLGVDPGGALAGDEPAAGLMSPPPVPTEPPGRRRRFRMLPRPRPEMPAPVLRKVVIEPPAASVAEALALAPGESFTAAGEALPGMADAVVAPAIGHEDAPVADEAPARPAPRRRRFGLFRQVREPSPAPVRRQVVIEPPAATVAQAIALATGEAPPAASEALSEAVGEFELVESGRSAAEAAALRAIEHDGADLAVEAPPRTSRRRLGFFRRSREKHVAAVRRQVVVEPAAKTVAEAIALTSSQSAPVVEDAPAGAAGDFSIVESGLSPAEAAALPGPDLEGPGPGGEAPTAAPRRRFGIFPRARTERPSPMRRYVVIEPPAASLGEPAGPPLETPGSEAGPLDGAGTVPAPGPDDEDRSAHGTRKLRRFGIFGSHREQHPAPVRRQVVVEPPARSVSEALALLQAEQATRALAAGAEPGSTPVADLIEADNRVPPGPGPEDSTVLEPPAGAVPEALRGDRDAEALAGEAPPGAIDDLAEAFDLAPAAWEPEVVWNPSPAVDRDRPAGAAEAEARTAAVPAPAADEPGDIFAELEGLAAPYHGASAPPVPIELPPTEPGYVPDPPASRAQPGRGFFGPFRRRAAAASGDQAAAVPAFDADAAGPADLAAGPAAFDTGDFEPGESYDLGEAFAEEPEVAAPDVSTPGAGTGMDPDHAIVRALGGPEATGPVSQPSLDALLGSAFPADAAAAPDALEPSPEPAAVLDDATIIGEPGPGDVRRQAPAGADTAAMGPPAPGVRAIPPLEALPDSGRDATLRRRRFGRFRRRPAAPQDDRPAAHQPAEFAPLTPDAFDESEYTLEGDFGSLFAEKAEPQPPVAEAPATAPPDDGDGGTFTGEDPGALFAEPASVMRAAAPLPAGADEDDDYSLDFAALLAAPAPATEAGDVPPAPAPATEAGDAPPAPPQALVEAPAPLPAIEPELQPAPRRRRLGLLRRKALGEADLDSDDLEDEDLDRYDDEGRPLAKPGDPGAWRFTAWLSIFLLVVALGGSTAFAYAWRQARSDADSQAAALSTRALQMTLLGDEVRGTLYIGSDYRSGVAVFEGLTVPIDKDRIYKLWYDTPEGPKLGRAFRPRDIPTYIQLRSIPKDFTRAFLTIEPDVQPAPTQPSGPELASAAAPPMPKK